MTGVYAWFGEQYQRGTGMAVEDLNAKGGVLGQRVELIVGDDFCDADQAVALARKLASDGVVFVAGHWCSHSSIAAAKVYEEAGILMIAPGSASAKLTDEGGPNVFRVCGRDDRQGAMVADYLADHWAGKEIAILDDGTTWGAGVADGVRRRLHERGVHVAMDETITPGRSGVLRAGLEDAGRGRRGPLPRRLPPRGGPDLPPGARPGLRSPADRQQRDGDRGLPDDRRSGARRHAHGRHDRQRGSPQAAEVVARFRAQGYEPLGYTLYAYAAVQVWAQAVEAAGSLDLDAVTGAMHSRQFDTVLGRIGFDEKGDVTGFEPWQWYVWQADGTYVPLEQSVSQQISPDPRASDFPHCRRSSAGAEYFPHDGGLNHGPFEIAVRERHFDCGTLR